ncbi:uncharacterized protein EAF02_007412 [Botrytis sinoallii]|uniref:uncharacterized protein n=1 Tax=Botrytis sinoallii TaxID=1463999 RepID=UPI001902173B|nr:uncharacterized protein EAF02_007412 [Botrytis sinoallii]KAF7880566.1 hypothetical protein EAF02_007412 [Botrytis sinoallii]
MPLLEDESTTVENDESTSEITGENKETRETKEEVLLIVYGIKSTEVEQTEADEKYGNFPCAQPSPLRKCWTLVAEDSKVPECGGEGSD